MQKALPEKKDACITEIEEKLAETQSIIVEMNATMAENFKRITENINEIIHNLGIQLAKTKSKGFEPSLLLEFPDHLRMTVKVLLELGMATAEAVSAKTHRSRSLESSYLNQLVRMNYVEREKKGQLAYYKIKFSPEKTSEG